MQRLEPRCSAGDVQPATARGKHRWTVVFAVPIVLFSLLWLGFGLQQQPVAHAQGAPLAYVGCDSDSPNFPNLPAAIETLGQNSTLNICPGTYFSGGNLSLMDTVGNITIQRKPGETGEVLIKTINEPAIYISETETFTGNVTLVGIHVTSQNYTAIALGDDTFCCPSDYARVKGSVVLSDVHATNAGLEGVLINATEHITVVASTSVSNTKEGFELNIVSPYEVLDSQVDAALVAVVTPTIYLNDVVADRSRQDDGISIGSYFNEVQSAPEFESSGEELSATSMAYTPFDLTIDNTQANRNGERGINANVEGNLTIRNTDAVSNGAYALIGSAGSGIIVNEGNLFQDAEICSAATAGTAVFENVNANENTGWGVSFASEHHNVYITNTTVISNAYDGLLAAVGGYCGLGGHVDLSNSLAEDNGYSGFLLFGASNEAANADEVHVNGPYPVPEPRFGGFRLLGDHVKVAQESEANYNEHFGFCVSTETPFGLVEVEDASAAGNGSDGVAYGPGCFLSLFYYEGVAQAEDEVEAAEIGLSSAVYITDTTAISNVGMGISLTVLYNESFIENVSTIGNNVGIAVNRGDIYLTSLDASVAIDSAVPLAPVVQIQDSLIQSNEFYGVLVDQVFPDFDYGDQGESLAAAATFTPTEVISQSIICQNGIGVGTRVSTVDVILRGDISGQEVPPGPEGALVDARGNWWGDKTGPKVAGNPEGKGDSIVTLSGDVEIEPYVLVEGTVLYRPWIDTFISLAQPNPTLPNIPVELLFQYTEDEDDGEVYYLADGVGDPNNPPIFTLSTDNGTFANSNNSNSVGKYIVNKAITGTLVPASAGVANVTLAGPCDLTQQVTVDVATPSIDIEKSPDLQGVEPDGTAVFTITIENTGNITLTEIAVADAVAPACARTVGAIVELGPGESTSYSCSHGPIGTNMENTAEVTARALVGDTAAGAPVSDSDSAEVRVVDLELSKTVYVAGYGPDCPVASDIKVPISSTVQYCYTVTNTGDYTVTTHSLVDDQLGTLFTDLVQELGPGQSYSTVDAGLTITDTLFVTTTNVATWTAIVGAPVAEVDASAVEAVIDVTAQTSALVRISVGGDDQDEDGIPDNLEGTGDLDDDGTPDFLDPDTPTGLNPGEQPNTPEQTEFLYLPSLRQQ